MKILYFSRGRGHGHAIPDMAVAAEIKKLQPEAGIHFVSYGTGCRTLQRMGQPVIDLALPEENPFLETLELAISTVTEMKPDLVLSDEEFAALPAASWAGTPCIFISHWFPGPTTVASESLRYADAIICNDEPGIFPLPVGAKAKPIYVGPITRAMKFTVRDRASLRESMGISPEALVVLAIPGGWANEDRAPFAETLLSAFVGHPREEKKLFWMGGSDSDDLRELTKGVSGVEVIPFFDPIECLMGAADVVVSKGTRGVALDAEAVGVPTISLSFGSNHVDDILVARMRNNTQLNARAVDGNVLRLWIDRLLGTPRPFTGPASANLNGVLTARAVLAEAARIRG